MEQQFGPLPPDKETPEGGAVGPGTHTYIHKMLHFVNSMNHEIQVPITVFVHLPLISTGAAWVHHAHHIACLLISWYLIWKDTYKRCMTYVILLAGENEHGRDSEGFFCQAFLTNGRVHSHCENKIESNEYLGIQSRDRYYENTHFSK